MCSYKFVLSTLLAIFVGHSEGDGNSSDSIITDVSKEPERKIFGGTAFTIKDAPYMALYFKYNDDFQCGASIIHERILVYAAHCYNPTIRFYVKVGTDNLRGGERYEIQQTVVHPKYDAREYDYDIALIKLFRPLKFSDRVLPIRLIPRNWELQTGHELITMGFGRNEHSTYSYNLLKVRIPYISNSLCGEILKERNLTWRLTGNMICAGGVDGKDACNGDSGGPLVYDQFLVGVVSFGHPHCESNTPGVFVRISAFRDFINSASQYLLSVPYFYRLP